MSHGSWVMRKEEKAVYAACRDVVARRARSFKWAIRLLPAAYRDPMASLYAFCRAADDAVDGPFPLADRIGALSHLRQAWARASGPGAPADPVLAAFGRTACAYDLPAADVEAVLRGCEADLEVSHYPTFAALAAYCDDVAGSVGRMSLMIFGCRDAQALTLAGRLGLGMQLVNILRDLREDAARGRIYLPEEDLARFGVEPEEILALAPGAGWVPLVRFEAARARETLAAADGLAAFLPPDVRFFPRALARTYRLILEKIDADGHDPLGRVPSVARWRVLGAAVASWARRR